MNPDYLTYWGISKPPFSLTPDPEMLYMSGQHSECLMRLKYAIFSHKGGALLVSDNAGNGKTSVLARLKNDLNDYYAGRAKVVFIDHPTLSPIEMIGEIAHQLGAELYTTEKIRALNSLRDRLFSLYNENIKVVVIVDEGQMLKSRTDLLQELRILLNFCVSEAFLLTFIFSGQKPLDTILREMPEFWQRLPVRFFLKNLDYNDTKSLIKFRLDKVGLHDDIFTDDAYEGIYNYSDGCPRVICSLADICLIIGFAKGVKRIGFVEVSTACRDMESSGDGYHYYAFMHSEKDKHPGKHDTKNVRSVNKPKSVENTPPKVSAAPKSPAEVKKPKESYTLAAPVTDVSSVLCQTCSMENPKELRFCSKCNEPLYTKCPLCSQLSDTVSHVCSYCGANIDGEILKIAERIKKKLKAFDILADGAEVWLAAKKITLSDSERVVIIFPRGIIESEGPAIFSTSERSSPKKACDFILTNKRLILGIGNDIIKTNLNRIDSFMPINTGSFMGRRHMLIVSFESKMYRISFPFNARKSKTIMENLSLFIQSVMLK